MKSDLHMEDYQYKLSVVCFFSKSEQRKSVFPTYDVLANPKPLFSMLHSLFSRIKPDHG